MSNTEASEDNVKSPSTYGNEGYEEYRKKEKKKNRLNSECLACGHKRKEHNAGDQSRCHKSKCPCLKFKPTALRNLSQVLLQCLGSEIHNGLPNCYLTE